jgi:hypothetical protein
MQRRPGTDDAVEAERILELVDQEQARRSIPGNIASFLEKFPDGFKDPRYLKTERDDKIAASMACSGELTCAAFCEAKSTNNPIRLIEAVKKVVARTNLIQGSFEKPKLYDAISDQRHSLSFLDALERLIHGSDEAPERLETFSGFMETLGLRKWTYGTYFLFVSNPVDCMFVKPEGIKKAIEIAGYPLEYDSEPTARKYREILAFARWVESKLRDRKDERLNPKDMIDTQSFIWHMAPTGKWAK